jgi:plastocyanin
MHPRTLLPLLVALALPSALAGAGHGDEPEPGLRSPDLAPGQSWSHTFAEAGRFDYHCHPHPWMLAALLVEPSTGRAPVNHTIRILEPTGRPFENWTFDPAITTIQAGDTVTWVNAGTVPHVIQETTAEHMDHVGVAKVAGAPGQGEGGFPAPGWAWIVGALAGGVLLGRLTAKWTPRQGGKAAAPPGPSQDAAGGDAKPPA